MNRGFNYGVLFVGLGAMFGMPQVGLAQNVVRSNSNGSTAMGTGALNENADGGVNDTASGAAALQSNTTGNNNTATGWSALNANTAGNGNTASGSAALQSNTTGINNTGSGYNALYYNTTAITTPP